MVSFLLIGSLEPITALAVYKTHTSLDGLKTLTFDNYFNFLNITLFCNDSRADLNKERQQNELLVQSILCALWVHQPKHQSDRVFYRKNAWFIICDLVINLCLHTEVQLYVSDET